MPHTENVQRLIDVIGPVYEFVNDDGNNEEMEEEANESGDDDDDNEKAEGESLMTNSSTYEKIEPSTEHLNGKSTNGNHHQNQNGNDRHQNGHDDDDDDEEDFCDTSDNLNEQVI